MDKVIEFFQQMFPDWYSAVRHPIQTCSNLLLILDEQERFKQGSRIWLASFVISFGVNVPLYHSLGIEWDTFGFHIFSLLCLTATMIAFGFSIHFSLRRFGIDSNLSDVTAMYVAYFMTYQPFIAILSYLSDFAFLATLRTAKVNNVGFGHALKQLWDKFPAPDSGIDLGSIGSNLNYWLFLGLVCVSSSLIATTVAERYKAPRLNCYSALAFAVSILMIPIFVVAEILDLYNMYSFSH